MKRNMKYLVVTLLVVTIILLPERVRAENTCFTQYELAVLAANNAMNSCMMAAYDNTPWYRPDVLFNLTSLCSLEFVMDSTEASVKLAKCMSIDLFNN